MRNVFRAIGAKRRWLIGIMAFLFILKVFTISASLVSLNAAANEISEALQQAMLNPSAQHLTPAVTRLGSAAGWTVAELKPFLAVAGLLPGDGCVLAKIGRITEALSSLTPPLSPLPDAFLKALLSASDQGLPIANLREMLGDLDAQAVTAAIRPLLNEAPCQGASPHLAAYQDALYGGLFLLQIAADIPWNTVLQDEARWLIVLSNSDELRPTGGFVTALVDLHIASGFLTTNLMNSYDVDAGYGRDDEGTIIDSRPAPRPLEYYMGQAHWLFRDFNWSPDYPTSARKAIEMYESDRDVAPPSGVIVINLSSLETFMRWLPPVTLNGETKTPLDVLNALRDAWNCDAPTMNSFVPGRKNFIGEFAVSLGQAILQSSGPVDLARSALGVKELLARKDVLIYAADPALQAYLKAQNWDGSLTTDGDLFTVINTNVGYNKVSSRAEQTYAYAVDITTLKAHARITTTNTNTNPVSCEMIDISFTRPNVTPIYTDRMTGCYWDYIRIYVPLDSKIEAFEGHGAPPSWFPVSQTERVRRPRAEVLVEDEFFALATMLVVPPRETREISFDYALPLSVIGPTFDKYTLTLQRQAGTTNIPYTIDITLPSGAVVYDATPPPSSKTGQTLHYEGVLSQDVTLLVRWTLPDQ